MTKQDLQKELLEKVKPGTKPSHLKKLKRSKSEGDIPKAPPLPSQSTPLNRRKSTEPFQDPQYPYTTLISQQEELDKLKKETTAKSDTISLLRKKIAELEKSNPPLSAQELDNSLFKRHKSLKDWFTQYQKNKELDQELKENINEASQELISQDQTISQLRGQVKHLELTNQSLTKDLDLSRRLVELRKNPLPENNSNYSHLLTWAFLALWLITLLNSSWNHNFTDKE